MKAAFVRFTADDDFYEEDIEAGRLLKETGDQVAFHQYDEDVDWSAFDLVNIKSCKGYDDEPKKFSKWLDECRKKGVRLMNSADLVEWNSDKVYLQDLQKEGFAISETLWIPKGAKTTLASALKESTIKKVVVKPSVSAGGRQTFLVEGTPTEEQEKEFSDILKNCTAMIQKFEPEVVLQGEVSLIFIGSKFSHGIIKRPAKGNFLIHEEFGGTAEVFVPDETIVKQAVALIEWINEPLLYARVDGIIKGDKLVLMELEIIEPSLWTELVPGACRKYADTMIALTERDVKVRHRA